ncbi:MAG: enoyl-CoA hydratase/isomerase family protein [Fimbriimonadaceae bacterium]|nr:enoyl-CoA hydratase/isomerase family protein [Fimbriimonadaceae bacterium]QYK54823.1 MAG: enoyl-CoA hydratase/isomerase family protein [Fimbriimonadaceae bacterium]
MLRSDRRGPVLHLTLDRPEVRNAFNDELIAALAGAFDGLDSDVRVVVLGGEGKAFSAGGDLEWMRRAADYTVEQNYADAMKLGGLFEAIAGCAALVVARVHGAAFGGGCGLVAAADVAVAAEGTLFAFSEVRLGLVPATISKFVVPKIGAGHARALFTTGEAFDAERALRIGLVHHVAGLDEIDARVEEVVKTTLKNGPRAVAQAKRLAQQLGEAVEMAPLARMLAEARAGEEGREGVAAFLDKRPASFVAEG